MAKRNLTEYVEVEKLVMAGSVDKELKSLYDNCLIQANLGTNCNIQLSGLLEEKSKFDKRLETMENNISEREARLNESQEKVIAEAKHKIKTWAYWGIGTLAGLILLTLYLFRDKKLRGHWIWQT